jgi:DNA helicase-2/ATP-dependent DNA helicase PcrA
VEAVDGPVLVLAGAGTGKTRVLTTRLAHILATGRARPWELLAVTFTNKAAREMRERITHLIGPSAEGLRWLGTFHSVAAQILRRHAELVGLKSSFTILDTDDVERLLKQIMEADGLDTKRWTPRSFSNAIDGWKNRGWTPDRLPASEDFAGGRGQALYAQYQDRLRILNACDFGDLLLHNITIFTKHPDVLAEFHGRFRYILVDEYQDTNVAQYLWLRLWPRSAATSAASGDDDQSIYGWRGAEVDNILRFERDFPGAKVIRLERNYRSTRHILAAASGLIASNSDRLGKTLWTDEQAAKGPRARRLGRRGRGPPDRRRDRDLAPARRRRTRRLREVAILVRASFQMRAFEERFVLAPCPTPSSAARASSSARRSATPTPTCAWSSRPDDDLAFERVVNTPKRGIGDASVQKLLSLARANGVSASLAARGLVGTDELPARTRTVPVQLHPRPRPLARPARAHPAQPARRDHPRRERLHRHVEGRPRHRPDPPRQPQGAGPGHGRLRHPRGLSRARVPGDGPRPRPRRGRGADHDPARRQGLEFPLVFLPGWEEGVFPSQRSIDEKGEKGLEEERRLAYVGITRAREEARVSFAANRQVYGRWTSQLPSRFVDELPLPTSRPAARPATTAAAPACRRPAPAGTKPPSSPPAATPAPAGAAPANAPTPPPHHPRQRGTASPSKAKAAWSPPATPTPAPPPTNAATASSTRSSAWARWAWSKATAHRRLRQGGRKEVIDTFVARG